MIEIDKAMRELYEATKGIALAQQRQNAAIRGLADAMAAEESINWRRVRIWQVQLDAATLAISNMLAERKTAQERLDGISWAHGAGGGGEGGKAAAGG